MYAKAPNSKSPNKNRVAEPASQQSGVKTQAYRFLDNRLKTPTPQSLQRKLDGSGAPIQFRADKRIEYSAKRHYADGWGAKYGITTDDDLLAKVPDSVRGEGEITLGIYPDGRRWWRGKTQYMGGFLCNILYKDVAEGTKKYRRKHTSIYHCGPTGSQKFRKV